MKQIREIEEAFSRLPEDQLSILIEIHNIVFEVNPLAEEDIRRYGIVYFDARRGGPVKAGICQVLVRAPDLHLAFIHGAFLNDPMMLLTGKTFPKRYMRLPEYDRVPWEYVRELIVAHNRLNPANLPGIGRE